MPLTRPNRFSIRIDDPDQSLSDEEESGVHGPLPSDPVGHEFVDFEDLHLTYPDEFKASDSASRPRNAHRSRHSLHGSRSASARRQTSRTARRQQMIPERDFASRSRARPHSSESLESVDSGEDFAGPFGRASERRIWPGVPQTPGYAQSSSSGPSYSAYPYGHGPYGHPGHQSDELLRLGQQPPYGSSTHAYGPQFQPQYSASMQPFYPSDQHRHHRQPPLPRADVYNPLSMAPPGGPPFNPQDLMPYGTPNHYYRDAFSMMPHQSYFSLYPQVPTPTKAELSSPAQPPVDMAKDDAIARLEKLILDDRTEREAREAAIARAQAEKAAQEERLAHDKKIAEQAAFLARADAEKRAAEDAAKVKEEAEKAAASAASNAAAAAQKPPAEKKKPIKFKDAVGRKFSFPFELCATWQVRTLLIAGMEDLIRQAFLHIEVIGPHVAEGHYDLVGPNGDIILPQVWETVIEPDWTITMHMWPVPEKPKDGAGAKDGAAADGKKKADPGNNKKASRPKKSDPGTIAMWMMGGRNPTRTTKAPKAEKKPEAAQ
ncbi:hypothetical protein N7510_002354 [Penicillium lagena]|uniref:uncharacterized protein n=1 Tax=Penicillium lagena TaxID=94218 RepID=UPI0025403184|nr:uncharacterized protein N7510_002354 [Penicillium lagena]KAJ5626045.1 hypothetical protein N7510_002354 [Penicillium lagena]